MNNVILRGIIKDIEYSHTINDVEYDKANLIVSRNDGKEDVISLKFKKFTNTHSDGDVVDIVGNLRSFSQKLDENRNKVSLYVFTYFDTPTICEEQETVNEVILDGRICKVDELRVTKTGKPNLHIIIANNIISSDHSQKLNNYIPSCLWGKLAVENQNLQVSDKVQVKGQLHSRTYKKMLPDGECEFRVAHELVITEILCCYKDESDI